MNQRLLQHLFGFLFLFLPFSHSLLLWAKSSFDYGGFSVWSAFFLQFQSLLLAIIVFVSLWVFRKKILQTFSFSRWEIGAFSLLLVPLFWIEDPVLHVLVLLHFIFVFLLCKVFRRRSLSWDLVGRYFVGSMAFVALLAIFQVIFQHSIGFAFIGEPEIAPNILGVAKIDLGTANFMRAYGTFLHPNILAFFSGLAFFVAERIGWKYVKWLFMFPLLLSFSRAGWLAFGISFFFTTQKISKKDLLIGLFLVGLGLVFCIQPILGRLSLDASFFERVEGIRQSLILLLIYPFGVGFQHFTLLLQNSSSIILSPWQVQPVHNSFLLLLNEVGVILFAGFIIFIKKIWEKSFAWQRQILIFMFIVGLADHYLWTSYNAQTFITLFLLSIFYGQKIVSKP